MIRNIPQFLIAAPTSGIGKTTVSRLLMTLLTQKKLRVQPYKCGPDYIDTKYHEKACGIPSYNLDLFMASEHHVCKVYNHHAVDADVCIVECQYETVTAVDVNGKLWTWGYDGENGLLGTGDKYTYDGSVNDYNDTKGYAIYPMCITDLENNELNTVKLVSVSATYYNNGAALDNDGNIWLWGENSLPLGHRYLNNPIPPTKLTISKVAHFEIPNFEKIDAGYYSSAGIDENGRVWTWGYSSYYGANLGTGIHKENNYSTAKPVMIGGHNNRICNERIVDVSVGYYHTLAIDDKGKLW